MSCIQVAIYHYKGIHAQRDPSRPSPEFFAWHVIAEGVRCIRKRGVNCYMIGDAGF